MVACLSAVLDEALSVMEYAKTRRDADDDTVLNTLTSLDVTAGGTEDLQVEAPGTADSGAESKTAAVRLGGMLPEGAQGSLKSVV